MSAWTSMSASAAGVSPGAAAKTRRGPRTAQAPDFLILNRPLSALDQRMQDQVCETCLRKPGATAVRRQSCGS